MTVTFDQADIFLVPLLDGDFCIGQIVDRTATPTSVLCIITKIAQKGKSAPKPITLNDLQSLLLIEPSSLADGAWPIVGFEQLPNVNHIFKWRDAHKKGYEGLQSHDPAIVEAFVNAAFGKYPWDAFGEGFFNNFLINPKVTPAKAILQSGKPA